MRILVAMMEHETNTFSPLPTRLEDFGPGGPLEGRAAYDAYRNSGYSVAGLLDLAESEGAEVETVIAANAAPARAVAQDAFEYIADRICRAVNEGCDALFLDLHGAMVTEGYPSGEGELLTRLVGLHLICPSRSRLIFTRTFLTASSRTRPRSSATRRTHISTWLRRDVVQGSCFLTPWRGAFVQLSRGNAPLCFRACCVRRLPKSR